MKEAPVEDGAAAAALVEDAVPVSDRRAAGHAERPHAHVANAQSAQDSVHAAVVVAAAAVGVVVIVGATVTTAAAAGVTGGAVSLRLQAITT
jgi:hypothetical protein